MRRYTVQITDVTLAKVERLLGWINKHGGTLQSLKEQSGNDTPDKNTITRKKLNDEEVKSVIGLLPLNPTDAGFKNIAIKFGVSVLTIQRIHRREGRYASFK